MNAAQISDLRAPNSGGQSMHPEMVLRINKLGLGILKSQPWPHQCSMTSQNTFGLKPPSEKQEKKTEAKEE